MTGLRTLAVAALLALNVVFTPWASAAADPREKIVRLRPDIEALLMKGAFDDLEALANDYRTSHARVKGGYWALSDFYRDLDWICWRRLRLWARQQQRQLRRQTPGV